MRTVAPRTPDYERLCRLAERAPGLDPDAVMAVWAVHAVGSLLSGALRANLAAYGTTEGRLRVLGLLRFRDGPATHSELAQESGVTKGTITGLVNGLERDRLVRRVGFPGDRRKMLIELTPAGRRGLGRVLPGHLALLSRMVRGLSRAQQKTLVRLLLRIQGNLPGPA